jgi:hypothetical protein
MVDFDLVFKSSAFNGFKFVFIVIVFNESSGAGRQFSLSNSTDFLERDLFFKPPFLDLEASFFG